MVVAIKKLLKFMNVCQKVIKGGGVNHTSDPSAKYFSPSKLDHLAGPRAYLLRALAGQVQSDNDEKKVVEPLLLPAPEYLSIPFDWL